MEKYEISREQWQNSDHKVKISGEEFYASKSSEWLPEKAERLGEVNIRKKKNGESDDGSVLSAGAALYPVADKQHSKFFYKELGWLKVSETGENRAEKNGYIRAVQFRKAVFLPIFIGIFAIIMVLMSLNNGVNPIYQPSYMLDQAGIVHNNKEQHAIIGSYSAYESVVDQTWKAGETHQDIRLSLPANVNFTDKDGEHHSETNPVDAAPHIYVDINHDGEYTEDECIFNPIKYNDDGSIEEIGGMIKPGNEIRSVELTKPLEAGEYDAKVVWTGVTSDTHEMANPMTFMFHIIVE